jgi:hypothetical protein
VDSMLKVDLDVSGDDSRAEFDQNAANSTNIEYSKLLCIFGVFLIAPLVMKTHFRCPIQFFCPRIRVAGFFAWQFFFYCFTRRLMRGRHTESTTL